MVLFVFGQLQPVDVAELTLKIGAMSTEELYYGFAEGDQIIFSFEEEKGKELKEIEIVELPGSSKFMDFKSSKVENKTINVYKQGVYLFRFTNSAMGGRICKVKIQRIPKTEELITFNTGWEWKTLYDTTYIPYTEDSIVGYDTILTPYTKNEIVRIDTTFEEIQSPDHEIWLFSRTNMKACAGKSESCTKNRITLSYPAETEYLLVWIGVGQETREAYNKLANSVTKTVVKGAVSYLTGGSSLLANSFTDNTIDEKINNLPHSKNVIDVFFTDQKWADFWFNDYDNRFESYPGLTYKDVVNFKQTLKKSQIPQNTMVLCLKNNSYSVGTSVSVSVVAVLINNVYEDVQYTKQEIKARYVTLHKIKMEIESSEVRVNEE
jgi:hypothetical protein